MSRTEIAAAELFSSGAIGTGREAAGVFRAKDYSTTSEEDVRSKPCHSTPLRFFHPEPLAAVLPPRFSTRESSVLQRSPVAALRRRCVRRWRSPWNYLPADPTRPRASEMLQSQVATEPSA